VISELYDGKGVTEELLFEHDLVENPIEPADRPMAREDFDAPLPLRIRRGAVNVVRAGRAIARLTQLLKKGHDGSGPYDLVYCNGTNADFAGGLLTRTSNVPALWHVRYTSLPGKAIRSFHDRLAAGNGVKRIVCVSKASAALFPHCPEKVRVIHNALDTSEFDLDSVPKGQLRSELGLPNDAVVFGSQGRILPRKGYMEMIEAARLALSRMEPEEKRRAFFVESDTRLTVYAYWGDRVAEDLRHEVAHGYLHAVVPGLPLWLDEGLAEYFEVPRGQSGLNRPHLEQLAVGMPSTWQPDLKRLEALRGTADMTQVDYAESWAWVHFLLETSPERQELLRRYLQSLGKSQPRESLSDALTRTDPQHVEKLREHLAVQRQALQ